MGTTNSTQNYQQINEELLKGCFNIYQIDDYRVTFHHTIQPCYNKCRIIKYSIFNNESDKSEVSNGHLDLSLNMDIVKLILSASVSF